MIEVRWDSFLGAYQFRTFLASILLLTGLFVSSNSKALSSCKPPELVDVGRGAFSAQDVTLRTVSASDCMELVGEDLKYIDSTGLVWTAPIRTYTDGASIPQAALIITGDRYKSVFLKAAIVHDAYCQEFNERKCPGQYRKREWEAVHTMFLEAMLAGGTPENLANMMFLSVWYKGPRWGDPTDKRDEVSEDSLERAYSGSVDWVERTTPTLTEMKTELKRREFLMVELDKIESKSEAALKHHNVLEAAKLLKEQDSKISNELKRDPDDLMLLNFQGSMYNNKAQLAELQGDKTTANKQLINAEKSFGRVIEKQDSNLSALTGLGKTSKMQGEIDKAKLLFRSTIQVDPKFKPARKELDQLMKKRGNMPQ